MPSSPSAGPGGKPRRRRWADDPVRGLPKDRQRRLREASQDLGLYPAVRTVRSEGQADPGTALDDPHAVGARGDAHQGTGLQPRLSALRRDGGHGLQVLPAGGGLSQGTRVAQLPGPWHAGPRKVLEAPRRHVLQLQERSPRMSIRLSRKADDKVDTLTHALSESVRRVAAKIAEDRGSEYADEEDVRRAYALVLIENASEIQKVLKERGETL